MRKFILIIILVVLNIYLFVYLKQISESKFPFEYSYENDPILINKKELSFYDVNEFVFDEHFSFICNKDVSYKYSFDEENIIISVLDRQYIYPYTILEKEKEIVKEIVYKEVSKPASNTSNHTSNNTTNNTYSNNSDYSDYSVSNTSEPSFTLLNSSLSYSTGTDLGTIITGISNSFIADSYVSLDYASLNPSCPGNYPVYLYTQDGSSYSIMVNIQ